MRRLVALLFVLPLAASASRADEGMWRPHQLPELRSTLKSMGMRIDPARLSDLMDYPMNAVIKLPGCTASFVSPEGLVITNHHCAYGSIQHNSSEERNLLQEGFLAASRSDELPARPGTTALVTIEIRDVTGEILGAVPEGASGRERYQAIEDKEKALIAECERDAGHRCIVVDHHGGLEYELIKRLEIRDVRLVHAPAAGIGNYGGDIDNWMWPRHTGDYSFFRAYVGRDGRPADYSEENVPYRPKHYLKISVEGVREGSLVFVAGYPGRTYRHALASEVENRFGWYYPTRKRLFLEWLDIVTRETADRPDAVIKYASLDARLNNSTKNYDGMLNGFAKSDSLERKRRLEEGLQAWVEADPGRKAKYLTAIRDLGELVARQQAVRERTMLYEDLVRRSDMLTAARSAYRLAVEREKPDAEREPGYQERDVRDIRNKLLRIERTFDPRVDRAFWRRFVINYAGIPVSQHVRAFDEWFGIQGNTIDEAKLDARLEEMYAGTKLGDKETRLAGMEKDRAAFEASDDPFIKLAVHLLPSDLDLEEEGKELDGELKAARPRYMEALIAYLESQGKPVYPDANSTLRVTYGTVKGYTPRDAVAYTPFTSLEGILEKDTGERPFDAPKEELAAIEERRFGAYYMEPLDSVPVNFLSTLDSTGGNSGSPVLNDKGELVGLLFDGNWEAIIADWDFIPRITRSIQVDIRYVLWVMDEVDGAHGLLREMGIRPSRGTPATAAAGR